MNTDPGIPSASTYGKDGGAYAVQGRAAVFISKINGSYSNVVGLPLFATRRLARKAGVEFYDNHGEGSSVG